MKSLRKILFVDRDGTLIAEPHDFQIDTLEKLELVPRVIPALLKLSAEGYRLVMVTNQDGLGSAAYPMTAWLTVQPKVLSLFTSQGLYFDDVLVCPHRASDGCLCRKPHLGLVRSYLSSGDLDMQRSAVVGDRDTDLKLAENMGIQGFKLSTSLSWDDVVAALTSQPRRGRVTRKTKETDIVVDLNLDGTGVAKISTGIGFFDHMLEQIARHAGLDMELTAKGDLHIDAHHTIEDVGLAFGQAFGVALGDKMGIKRYGFTVPMDEAQASVHAETALDISGRPWLRFEAAIPGERVGEFPTEMVSHFFQSFAQASGTTLHIKASGDNAHHMIEAIFKAFAKALGQAKQRTAGAPLPSTKGML